MDEQVRFSREWIWVYTLILWAQDCERRGSGAEAGVQEGQATTGQMREGQTQEGGGGEGKKGLQNSQREEAGSCWVCLEGYMSCWFENVLVRHKIMIELSYMIGLHVYNIQSLEHQKGWEVRRTYIDFIIGHPVAFVAAWRFSLARNGRSSSPGICR